MMMASRTLRVFSIILLFLSTLTSAWPWPRWLPGVDTLIVRRADDPNSSSSTGTNAASSASQTPKQSTSADSQSQSSTKSTKQSGDPSTTGAKSTLYSVYFETETIVSGGHTSTETKTFTSTENTPSHPTTYADTLPAGSIAMITPAVIDGPQYYRVGSNVTFVWNYTNVLATPTAVDILATCTANNYLYPIALNQTVGNATGAVTWDTGAYQATAVEHQLLTDMYTLVIYDAASGISATAQPGYLAVYEQYAFGVYTPQAATSLASFVCATCSGALSDMERRALKTVFGVCIITVLSFTWFVGGLGVIW